MPLPEAYAAPPALRGHVVRGTARADSPQAAIVHVLDRAVFRAAVIRERKRADRSRQCCALLLVGPARASGPDVRAAAGAMVACVAAARRDTDMVGWARRDTVGLLMPGTTATVARKVAARLHRELTSRMPEQPAAITVRVHLPRAVHVAGTRNGDDPWLDREEPARRRLIRDVAKRGLDVVAAVTLLVLLSPLLGLVAIAVKLTSRGPVLYRQVRVGWRERPFRMLKFRTMHVDADARIHHQFVTRFITDSTSGGRPGTSMVFKLTNDPRVTRAGHLLRKTSLDELPQLWNVIRGDMSLVGPRPPLPYEVEHYQAWHRRRILEAKPGLTGLWQVKGRSRTTFDEMVRLDLRYARTRSFWLDIKILLATPGAVISGKGAC